jgi:hypothetical protein
MRITRSQLRRLIREQIEDEQLMYIEKVQKLFPSDVNQAIELADMAGIGDTKEVQAMKDTRNLIVKFLEDWVKADASTARPDYDLSREEEKKKRGRYESEIRDKFYSHIQHGMGTVWHANEGTKKLGITYLHMTIGYRSGLKYRPEEIVAANELADWAGVPHPDLVGNPNL